MSTHVMVGKRPPAGALKKFVTSIRLRRAIIALTVFFLGWEFGSRAGLPWIGHIPYPSSVLAVWIPLLGDMSYWESWVSSFRRVLTGFFVAVILGVPFGLALATSRVMHGIAFPVFEVLRPIPPLAWVPIAIIFWPTQELAIVFVTFLGAFYTIVINVVGGAKSIDVRYFQAARSMGSNGSDIFRRIILPGVTPSIFVGMAVGVGITWEVVVAAEMISGGGSQAGGTAGGGLGFLIWNSYIGGTYEQIVVGMISIGIAGYACAGTVRWLGVRATPWRRLR